MAHERFKNWTLEVPLSHSGIEFSLGKLDAYKEELLEKIDIFTERMAKLGVEFAKERLLDYDAIDTWALFGSLDVRKGDAVHFGSKWIIFTDNFYAQYVEFGTGPVGAKHPHPSGKGKYRSTPWAFQPVPKNWKGAIIRHKGEEYAFTAGMPARPFMWDTWEHLKQEKTVKQVAKEVFG